MSIIEGIVGREILDSRGNPTVEVEVELDSGATGVPRCPRVPPPARSRPSSCATVTPSATCGKGVSTAVDAVNGEIADAVVGLRRARPA